MKINKFVISLIYILFLSLNSYAEDVDIESSQIEIKDNGNLIIAYNSDTFLKKENIKISSKIVNYYKSERLINFNNDVIFDDLNNKVKIKSDEIIYDINKEIVNSVGDVILNFDDKYIMNSKNLFYDRINQVIFSSAKTIITDFQKNSYLLENNFRINLLNNTIKANKAIITDKDNNKFYFENLMINLNNNHIAGKEIKIEFERSYFGNKKNKPELMGRSAYSDEENLRIYNAVFSTCNTDINMCRGWELISKEFNHDKKNKLFEYKNSWLKIFDYKIFYLPYFNHPDPTIKRKSGFLTPYYSSSDTLGTSINIPYFKTLGMDKDITFNPRIYADNSFLFQNEYRQYLEKSKILSDFSVLIGSEGTKSHLFYNQIGQLKEKLSYKLNIQDVKGDNYLKKHKLAITSPLIENESLLLSNLDLDFNNSNFDLNTSFKIYEDLSRNYHDRYQYILPDFSFKKNIDIPSNYNGVFDFHSHGYHKNFETNITEAVVINDFIFTSNNFFNSKGIVSKYNLLLKNTNNYSRNSGNFSDDKNYDLFTMLKYDLSLPLQKKLLNYKHYLKPIVSLKYSPNGNSDLSSKDVALNYSNVFELNRINTDTEVEGGESLTVGLEFSRESDSSGRILDFKLANVIKPKKDNNLPTKSKLDQTRSDIFGELRYDFNDNFKIGYYFSYDRDFKSSNLEGLDLELKINNFITNFNYYTDDTEINNSENIKNETKYFIDDKNKIGFSASKDLKEDFTQYYDVNYEYKNDCISVNLTYNKTFYEAGNLEPNKSISFLIKIIPFTELGVANISSVFGN